ncbi:MAG: hypothetical protein ABSD63_11890 [Candidatus Korobacteraceae bacterium]|jgi:hypothetical protein
MRTLFSLLCWLSVVTFVVGVVSIIKPLKILRITSRWTGLLLAIASFVALPFFYDAHLSPEDKARFATERAGGTSAPVNDPSGTTTERKTAEPVGSEKATKKSEADAKLAAIDAEAMEAQRALCNKFFEQKQRAGVIASYSWANLVVVVGPQWALVPYEQKALDARVIDKCLFIDRMPADQVLETFPQHFPDVVSLRDYYSGNQVAWISTEGVLHTDY